MTVELKEACRKWGMKIHADKSKIVSPEERRSAGSFPGSSGAHGEDLLCVIKCPSCINGQDIERNGTFISLGSIVPGKDRG